MMLSSHHITTLHYTIRFALFPITSRFRKNLTVLFVLLSLRLYRKGIAIREAEGEEKKKDNNRDDDIRERFVRTHNHTYTNTPFCQKKKKLHKKNSLIQKLTISSIFSRDIQCSSR